VRLGARTGEHRRLLGRECRDALLGLEVVLHVELIVLGIGPGECVRPEAVHLPVVGRDARSPNSQVNMCVASGECEKKSRRSPAPGGW